MRVEVISIAKKERSLYDPLYKEMQKMISRFTDLKDIEIFPKDVAKAHTISANASQRAYTKVLSPYLGKAFTVVLHPDGRSVDSFEFSKLLSDKMAVKFFIGGAYGFEDAFLRQCDQKISLGRLTMSHKVAKAVLLEQIYRGFSILNDHPYHK